MPSPQNVPTGIGNQNIEPATLLQKHGRRGPDRFERIESQRNGFDVAHLPFTTAPRDFRRHFLALRSVTSCDEDVGAGCVDGLGDFEPDAR